MVKINLCADCFQKVERAPMKRVAAILGKCAKCYPQIEAVRIASKMNSRRVTFRDVLDVLGRSKL